MAEPPIELALGWQMRHYRTLLAGGGLLDQPRALLITCTACVQMYDAMKEYNAQPLDRGIDWMTANPDKARLVDWYELEQLEAPNND